MEPVKKIQPQFFFRDSADMKMEKYPILYVDKDLNTQELFVKQHEGRYIIHVASSGKEGIEKIKKYPIKLILINQVMPQINGIDFINEAIKITPFVPKFILVTSEGFQEAKKKVKDINCRVIEKPISHDNLDTIIDIALQAYESRKVESDLSNVLQVSQGILRQIIKTSKDAIVTIDDCQNIIMANESTEKLFGYAKSELLNKPLSILIPDDYYEEKNKDSYTVSRSIIESRYMKNNLTVYGRTSSGKLFPIETEMSVMEIDGRLYFNAIIRDITEKIKTSEKLEQSEEEFRILAESAPIMIIKVNDKFQIEYINRARGIPIRNIIGQSLFLFIPEEEHKKVKKKIAYVFKTGKPVNYEVLGVTPEEKIWFGVNAGAIIKNGKIESVMLVVQDITNKKEAEDKVHQQNYDLEEIVNKRTKELKEAKHELEVAYEKEKELGELKSRFVATASHQFRTPLTVIQSSVGVLAMQLDNMDEKFKPQFEKSYERIKGQIQRMTALMNDVLVLGKLNSGNIQLDLQSVDILALAKDIVTNYDETQTDGRKMNVIVKGNAYPLILDVKLIEHALSNIISNAFKYSVGKKAPCLTISFEKGKVKIIVQDFGIGIPEKDIRHIFEPFYRASNVKEFPGTGLGTAIIKEYVELNKGTIEVKSELNKGTSFKINLKNNLYGAYTSN